MNKYLVEGLGTMWLVLGGCGTAVLAGAHVGWLGVALAFGLTVLTMAYTVGGISGCHLNPAVTVGCAVAGRISWKETIPYIISQIIGGILGAGILYMIVTGSSDSEFIKTSLEGFACNGYGEHSPCGFNLEAAAITEFVMTFVFLVVILGTTGAKGNANLAGLAIGLCLTLIHLISIPVTNTSVNPARSISQVLFAQNDWAVGQLWLFIVAPIAGAAAAGFFQRLLEGSAKESELQK